MNFGQALEEVKAGRLISREGWNGKNMFVYYVSGGTFSTNRKPLTTILGENVVVNYRSHLDMKYADGSFGVWLASQSDILADDWIVV